MVMFLFAPVFLRAQGTSSSPAPPQIKGPTLTPYQQAKAEAETKMTNVPARLPPGTELIGAHLSGELVTPLANYWDGVDDQNNLHVFVGADPVLDDVGVFRHTGFPPSVNVVDMNNDGLKDIVVGDRHGYLWIYFNSGKKGKPQFTTGTLIPTFLGVTSRIHVVDWDGDGDNDIILGTFYGDFQVLSNIGMTSQPKFTRSMGLPRLCPDYPAIGLPQLMLGKKPFVLGIYMAPWVLDWNKDGKKDLIFGEGTYSANSVRIAFNSGSPGKPAFTEDSVFFLAYGEGYEQLVPSVVDYNGDGIPDVMCGTRTGQIRLYKGTGKTVDAAQTFRGIKAPAAMDFDKNLLIENLEVLETMTAPFPCDWNDDGLFDIVMGSTKGTILVALNQGTKTEPSFPHIETVKGTNVDSDLVGPTSWAGTVGRDFTCNSAGYLSCEKALVLKTGMPPVKPVEGAVKPVEDVVKPVEGQYFLYFRYMKDYPGWTAYSDWTDDPGGIQHHASWNLHGPGWRAYPSWTGYDWAEHYRGGKVSGQWVPGARTLSAGNVGTMTIGKQYVISFSYILIGRGPAGWRLSSAEGFEKYNEEFDDYDSWGERRDVDGTSLPPTAGGWQKKTMNFTCPGEQRGQVLVFPMVAVPGVGVAQSMTFSISFWLPAGDSQFLLDNFSLKEVGGAPTL